MPAYLLVSYPTLDNMFTWCGGIPVSAHAFLAGTMTLAATLPSGGHMSDICADRYRLAIGLGTALVAGKVSLPPPMQAAQMVRQPSTFAPGAFCLHDVTACPVDLPALRYPDMLAPDAAPIDVPQIDMS